MNDGELWGIGRTWLAFGLVTICVTVALALGSVTPDFWRGMVEWLFAFAAGKSALCGAIGKLGGKQ